MKFITFPAYTLHTIIGHIYFQASIETSSDLPLIYICSPLSGPDQALSKAFCTGNGMIPGEM